MTLSHHQKEILEKFKSSKFAKEGGSCFECCDYEEMYADLKQFISAALNSQIEVIKDTIGSFVVPNHQGIGEDEFFCGFTEAKERVLMLLTPHEEEKK